MYDGIQHEMLEKKTGKGGSSVMLKETMLQAALDYLKSEALTRQLSLVHFNLTGPLLRRRVCPISCEKVYFKLFIGRNTKGYVTASLFITVIP